MEMAERYVFMGVFVQKYHQQHVVDDQFLEIASRNGRPFTKRVYLEVNSRRPPHTKNTTFSSLIFNYTCRYNQQ